MAVSKEDKEKRSSLRDEIREQRALLRGRGWKAYAEYYWEYYRYITLGVILGGGILIYLLHMFLTAKPQALGAVFLNTSIGMDNDMTAEKIEEQFADYAGISPKEYDIFIDTTRYLQPGLQTLSYSNTTTLSVIITRAGSGLLDIMVADADNFAYYADMDSFRNLEEFFTKEELSKLEGRLYYVDRAVLLTETPEDLVEKDIEKATGDGSFDSQAVMEEALRREKIGEYVSPDPGEMEDPVPVGVYLQEDSYVEKLEFYEGTVVVAGIMASTAQEENAKQFIRFLIEETPNDDVR